jgi:hypothetical protein
VKRRHACFLLPNSHVATKCTVCTQYVFCLCCNLDLEVDWESIHPAPQYLFQTSLSEWSDVLQRKTMDCFSSIFSLSFQDFYISFGWTCFGGIFSPYPPYTATWYNTLVSCSQIAMSPQNVLSVHSVSSVSVVILIWRLCQNIIVCLQFCTSVLQWRQVVNNSMKQHYWCDGFSLTLPPYTHVYLVIHILIKLLDLSNAFLVEYLLTAMPDISTSVLKQKNNASIV